MTANLHQTAQRLSDLHRAFGTITDLSLIPKIPESEIICGLVIGNILDKSGNWFSGIAEIQEATRKGYGITLPDLKIDFWRQGRKIQAFATAYTARQQHTYKAQADGLRWTLTKSVCRWLITEGETRTKEKCTGLLNRELDETDFQFFTDNGAGFLKKYDMDTETQDQKDVARVFIDARDNLEKHLTQIWLELFHEKGIPDAVKYMQDFWKPENQEAKDKINAAYLAAKLEYSNTTK